MIDLSPHASATHWTARYVGLSWSSAFNCWHLVQAVEREVFGRPLASLPVGAAEDQTAALLAITTGWERVPGDAAEAGRDGDVLTMIGNDGPHVGVVAGVAASARVLHNVGSVTNGRETGSVRLDRIDELGRLGFGHLKLWRAAT